MIYSEQNLKSRLYGWNVLKRESKGAMGRLSTEYLLSNPDDPMKIELCTTSYTAARKWARDHKHMLRASREPWKIYVATFKVCQSGGENNMVFHCKAHTADEACRIAKREWHRENPRIKMRNLHATRSRIQDERLLHVRTWRDALIVGPAVMDFYCTGYHNAW